MKCSQESNSSLFSRSHSAVSLRTNLVFFSFLKKLQALGVFISDPLVPFPLPDSDLFSFPAGKSCQTTAPHPQRPLLPCSSPPTPAPLFLSFCGPSKTCRANRPAHAARTSPRQATQGCKQSFSFLGPPRPQKRNLNHGDKSVQTPQAGEVTFNWG